MKSPVPTLCVFLLLAAGGAAAGPLGAVRALHVSGSECWAAGDHGLILRSRDAGKTWQRVACPAAAHLQFISRHKRTLYFYGGRPVPGHPRAAGAPVILRLRDGDDAPRTFPAPPQGWLYGGAVAGEGGVAFGQAHPDVPGGIWRTLTGGKLWKPLPVASDGFLLTGAFRTPFYGYVVGRHLRIISVRNFAQPRIHPPEEDSDLVLRAAAFAGEERCWAVGDTGTVLASRPTGQPWRQMDVRLPLGTRRLADFEALAIAPDGRVWIGGGLIGIGLHTGDGGRTWQHWTAPGAIHDLAVVKGNTLLAAGDAGGIWRSEDAGKTWQGIHGGGRTHVLFVLAATDRSLHPAIVAHAQADLNVAVVYVTRPPADTFSPPDQPLRAAALAAGARGAAVLNDFPSLALARPGREITDRDVLAHWSAVLDTPAEPILLRQLAAAIRLYRPSVLVVGPDGQGPRGPGAENRLVARLTRQAATLAGKTSAYKELAAAGLKPWTVQRVFVAREESEQWRAPWEPAEAPQREAGVSVIDTAGFPAGSDTTLEMLTMRALWHLPWHGLTDRPGRFGLYRCREESRSWPLLTTGLAKKRLRLRTVSRAQRDAASAASIRLAAARKRVATAMPRLVVAAKAAGEGGASDLVADRMLLVWLRLRQEGRLVQAQQIRKAFLEHGRRHPLWTRVKVTDLAEAHSDEWKAQLVRHGPPSPKSPAQVQADIRRLAAATAWRALPGGRALYARTLSAGGRGPAGLEEIRRLARGGYDPPWRAYATLELALRAEQAADPGVRELVAGAVTERGAFDGRLDEAFWQKTPAHAFRDAAGKPAPLTHFGTVQAIRTAVGFLVFGIRLSAGRGRSWEIDLALDADRDAWTQLVLRWNTAGRRSAQLLTRHSPPAELDKNTFSIRGHDAGREYTFEVGLAPAQVGQDAKRPGLWRFQLRAIARDPGKVTPLYFQQQPDRLLLPHRYGLLHIPAGK